MVKRSEKASNMSATEVARSRFIELCGPRPWNGTRVSWLANGARKARLTFRKAKSLFYNEQKLRLSADEYVAIEDAWEASTQAVAASELLARNAEALADSATQIRKRAELSRDAEAQARRAEALRAQCRAAADAALSSRRG